MISANTATKARDVMAVEPLRVKASTTIRQLARVLSEDRIVGAPIVNQEGTLIGVVSKTELLRACSEAAADCSPAYLFEVLFEQGSEHRDEAADAMTKPLVGGADFVTQDSVMVTPDTTIATIASLMLDRRIHRIIVLEPANLPTIIVTTFDLSGVLSK